jgi:diacylglycerol kinase
MEAIWDTAATPAVPLTLSEAHSQAALVLAVRSLEALTLVVRSLVALTVEVLTLAVHEVVVAVTSEATDKQGYSSSVRTSAFDIL